MMTGSARRKTINDAGGPWRVGESMGLAGPLLDSISRQIGTKGGVIGSVSPAAARSRPANRRLAPKGPLPDGHQSNEDHDGGRGEAVPSNQESEPLEDPDQRKNSPIDPQVDPVAARIRVEAVLFLSSGPVSPRRLAALAGLSDATAARATVGVLNEFYTEHDRAMRVESVAGGYRLMTAPHLAPWLSRLSHLPTPVRLSLPMLETLAVVAYRGPVSRADIESIRGVACGELLRQLIGKNLVRIAGRSEELGRPYLYDTTKLFLQTFGLRSTDDLPTIGLDDIGQQFADARSTDPLQDQQTSVQAIADQPSVPEPSEDSTKETVVSIAATIAEPTHQDDAAIGFDLRLDDDVASANFPASDASGVAVATDSPAAVIEDEEDDLYEDDGSWDDDDDDWDDPDDDDDIDLGDDDDDEDETDDDDGDDGDDDESSDEESSDLDDDWEEVDDDESDDEFEGDDDPLDDDEDWGEDDENVEDDDDSDDEDASDDDSDDNDEL